MYEMPRHVQPAGVYPIEARSRQARGVHRSFQCSHLDGLSSVRSPVAVENTAAERRYNRRVEFEVVIE